MKIILADDHPLFREGLKLLLHRLGDEVSMLEAGSHDSALKLLADNPDADLALIDLNMPGRIDGLSGLTEILGAAQTVPIVVLSGSENLLEAHQVIKAGAMGFIPKKENSEVILCALRLVLSGSVYVPPMLLPSMTGKQQNQTKLTPKQIEVLQQMCKGYSNKEIGKMMGLTESTIKCHTSAVFRELDVGSRTQALSVAKQRGWIS